MFGSLVSGSIQAAEWTLSVGSYGSLPNSAPNGCGTNCAEGEQTGYTVEGIAFNTLRPYINSVAFRRAMEYLSDYSTFQSTVLSGIAGSATPYWLPTSQYGAYAYQAGALGYNLVDAENELLLAGLVGIAGNGQVYCSSAIYNGAGNPYEQINDPSCTINTASGGVLNAFNGAGFSGLVSGLVWYRHENPSKSTGKAGTSTLGANCAAKISTWSSSTKSKCEYEPNFDYRSDDPLRSAGALQVIAAASIIGLNIHGVGITDAESGAKIYGAAEAACTFNPVAVSGVEPGCIPIVTHVNSTNPNTVSDGWDMYTFGWVLNVYGPVDSFFFFNAFFSGLSDNFGAYNNATMNTDTANLYYATSLTGAQSASQAVGSVVQNQLPYLTWWFESQLWAVNTNGWAGFSNVDTTGPTTSTGIYYTSLNAHSTANGLGDGGNLEYAIHAVSDPGGMDPLYNTNWVWQADIWSEIYDSPLGVSPGNITTINGYMDWMTTNWMVQPFSGATPSGTGVSDFQVANCTPYAHRGCSEPSSTSQTISGGEEITLVFRNNMTFSDNVPITAEDYNFSLFAWDLAEQPWTPSLYTPTTGEMAGSAGLISDQVTTCGGLSCIHLYIGSYTVWNLADVIVDVLPAHVFQGINLNEVATEKGTMNLFEPYTKDTAGCTWAKCTLPGNRGKTTEAVKYLANLEVGSGPYWMETFNPTTGAGVLAANANYQRTAWTVNATDNTYTSAPTSISLISAAGDKTHTDTSGIVLSPIREYTYNAATNTHLKTLLISDGLATHATGWVYIPGANLTTDSIAVYKVSTSGGVETSTLESGVTASLSCTGSYSGGHFSNVEGQCTGSLSGTGTLTAGSYEVVFTATYTYLGLARTWYQFTGFTIS